MRTDHATYHNTNQESGETLIESDVRAKGQEGPILRMMQAAEPNGLTPCETWSRLAKTMGADCPIVLTSVRRAITNLTTAGTLDKTKQMRQGMYGKKVHVWRVAQPKETLFE